MTRTALISDYTRINRQYEDAYLPKVKTAIHTTVKHVIDKLKSGGYDAANTYLHTTPGNSHMALVIQDLYKTVGIKHARLTYSRLLHDSRRRKSVTTQLESKGFGFNANWIQFITDYLKRFLLDKVTFEISNTTRDALLRTLSTAITAGFSVDQTVDALNDWPFERFQAARIVRTEVNRAANVGATAQAKTADWQQQKEWIAVHDFRTRGQNPKDHASHIGLDGSKIDEDDLFIDPRNGDRLLFPGDPNGKAESTINCRCMAAYTWKRDINGNLIPKRRSTTVIYPSQQRVPQIVIP